MTNAEERLVAPDAATWQDIQTPSERLVRRAATGDADAFATLVAERIDRAFRIALGILGSEADARDAVQDACIGAWEQLPRLRDTAKFDAWFGRILVNGCRSRLRHRRRITVREIAVEDLDAAVPAPHGRGLETDATELDALERAFDRLSADERLLLVLHHVDRRGVAEIAEWLDIPNGTAKSRLFSARRALERALEEEAR